MTRGMKEESIGNMNVDEVIRLARAGNKRRRGEAHPQAKLTEDAVRTIRAAATRDDYPGHSLMGRVYHVSGRCIRQVVGRETWKHVSSPASE